MKKVQYCIGVLLILVYIAILSLTFFPRASDDYMLSFGKGVLMDYPTEGLEYNIGREIKYNGSEYTYKNLGKGWSGVESDFVWGCSDKMYLYFSLQEEDMRSPLVFEFVAAPYHDEKDVKIYVDDNYVNTVHLTSEATYQVTIQPEHFAPKYDYKNSKLIEIMLETSCGPSPLELGINDDSRTLSLYLKEARLVYPELCNVPYGLDYVIGNEINYSNLSNDFYNLGSGWSDLEDWGVWSVGNENVLNFGIPSDTTGTLELSVDLFSFHEPRDLGVYINDKLLDTITVDVDSKTYSLSIPEDYYKDGVPYGLGRLMTVKFTQTAEISPHDLDENLSDTRDLGVAMTKLIINQQ